MIQTPEDFLSRHTELSAAAQRTGRRYGRYCLVMAALYAVMLLAIGLLPLPQPVPVLLALGVFLAGLAALTIWQLRQRATWPRYLTPVHVGVVLALALVNAVAVVGGTGLLIDTGSPTAWFVGGAVAAVAVGVVAWIAVQRGSRGGVADD